MYTSEVKFGPLLAAGSLIGLGMGGLLDGIMLHQIFQFHHLISARVSSFTYTGLKINLLWDGIFHLFSWFTMATGLGLLWRSILNPFSPKSTPAFAGSLLLGWGLFNLIEGLTNHLLLRVHHLIDNQDRDETLFWDLIYLLSGVVLISIGRKLISHGKRDFFSKEIQQARHRKIKFRPAHHRPVSKSIERLGP